MKPGERMSEADKAKRKEAAAKQWTPERRAAQAKLVKERIAAKRSSASAPSESFGSSSGVPVLPPTVQGEAAGSESLLNSLLAKLKETTTPAPTTKPRPELPEEADEREAALRPARFPARIPVVAVNEMCRVLGLEGLSDDEREEGINAFAVLFWQWGLFKDGRVLVALWLFGVAAPRATQALLKWQQEKAAKRLPGAA